jgi:hypothetical protein
VFPTVCGAVNYLTRDFAAKIVGSTIKFNNGAQAVVVSVDALSMAQNAVLVIARVSTGQSLPSDIAQVGVVATASVLSRTWDSIMKRPVHIAPLESAESSAIPGKVTAGAPSCQ